MPQLFLEEPWTELDSELVQGGNIQLTEKEEKIFSLLMEVVEENELSTTLRVAGGWVRDKMFGKQSNDIDIAIDDMLGSQFAEIITAKIAKN